MLSPREKIEKLISEGCNVIIYCDMDGVLFDFEDAANKVNKSCKEFKLIKGAYRNLTPYPHAFEVLNAIEEQIKGVKIHLLTKIPDDNPFAATEKLLSLREKAPNRAVNVTITNDKGSVGGKNDYLIDDRPHKAKVNNFRGELLHFGQEGKFKSWKSIVEYFEIDYIFE